MRIEIDGDDLKPIVRQVLNEAGLAIHWPADRLCLTESEAASACGVARHVIRDLRLAGTLPDRRLGKRVVYTLSDLTALLARAETVK